MEAVSISVWRPRRLQTTPPGTLVPALTAWNWDRTWGAAPLVSGPGRAEPNCGMENELDCCPVCLVQFVPEQQQCLQPPARPSARPPARRPPLLSWQRPPAPLPRQTLQRWDARRRTPLGALLRSSRKPRPPPARKRRLPAAHVRVPPPPTLPRWPQGPPPVFREKATATSPTEVRTSGAFILYAALALAVPSLSFLFLLFLTHAKHTHARSHAYPSLLIARSRGAHNRAVSANRLTVPCVLTCHPSSLILPSWQALPFSLSYPSNSDSVLCSCTTLCRRAAADWICCTAANGNGRI